MCGICGQYNFLSNKPVEQKTIEKMTETLVHRGPDDAGFYYSGSLGFGFRRLSIIDLDSGHQPMSDPEGRIWVVFNGEIYNFPELKKILEARQYVFRTTSDTEVIVHGYREWGVNVLDHLNGMFGLAVWDDKEKTLMIARDRMGIKPIYYKLDSNGLIFGSEIRPILAESNEKPEPDPVALSLFLQFRYTPSPLTVFKGIKKLSPGTRLIIRNGSVSVDRWWKYTPEPFDPMPSVEQATEEVLDLYKQAVKRQLISDVPVGLLLSGGIDSALLLALMNLYGQEWKTFTIGFGSGFQDDELSLAAQTAKIMNSPNFCIQIDRAVFEESMPKIISALEEPVAAPSVVPMYHVCRQAREQVKVVLTGQGPDELFGGYKRHLGVQYGKYWRFLPEWVRNPAAGMIQQIPRNEALKRAVYSLNEKNRMKRYQLVFSLISGKAVSQLFRAGVLHENAANEALNCWRDLEPLMQGTDELGGLQFLEIRSSLPDELLMYSDKLSMAHGLEARVPYLDQEVVEYVERLSASFKIHAGSKKWLHRKIGKQFLPKEIVNRKKLGFVTPVDEWFQASVAGKMETMLLGNDSLVYRYLEPEKVKSLMDEHRKRKCNNFKILFSIAILEEWFRCFVK